MRSRIDIDKKKMPYQFQILLGGKYFNMEWHYNSVCGVFICDLYDSEGGALVYGEPLVYGSPMFSFLSGGTELPAIKLVPIDSSGQESTVTWDNFGRTVFLTLEDEKL